MINEPIVGDCREKLETQLRVADEYLLTCPKWARDRARRQRNALNAACNALFRFSRV